MARSANNVAYTGAGTPRGRFVIVRNKEFCGEGTPVMWNIDFSGSVFDERAGFRFHQCFLKNRHFAGGIQYEVNHVHVVQCVCLKWR